MAVVAPSFPPGLAVPAEPVGQIYYSTHARCREESAQDKQQAARLRMLLTLEAPAARRYMCSERARRRLAHLRTAYDAADAERARDPRVPCGSLSVTDCFAAQTIRAVQPLLDALNMEVALAFLHLPPRTQTVLHTALSSLSACYLKVKTGTGCAPSDRVKAALVLLERVDALVGTVSTAVHLTEPKQRQVAALQHVLAKWDPACAPLNP